MNLYKNLFRQNSSTTANYRHMAGTTLIEVLIAIVIFIVGMLALAHLQGNLTRSSSDANMRTVAASIAEEIMEDSRNFQVISTTADLKAYDDIVGETLTRSRGGLTYTVVTAVQAYLFDANKIDVNKVANTVPSDFKHLKVTVTWGSGTQFHIDETRQTSDQLGGGTLVASTVIPRILDLNDAKVAAEDDGALGYPPVAYTPGAKPDIVAISLGDDKKFKESTTPEPVVVRRDEIIETWFDVITYSTDEFDDSVFLRREEFASVSCMCNLRAASGSNKDGRQPTIWSGAEYVEGETVGKQFGVSASNQQSQYCDVCCNDHHDTSRGPDSYRPGTSQANGNHAHYDGDRNGNLTEVAVGDDYIEACRLVRKDGFFRVAQDFDLKNQTAFPEDYLDTVAEIGDYSSYVTDAVAAHFSGSSWPANTLPYKGRLDTDPTDLPTTWAPYNNNQQLRSRGIYTDVASAALQANLLNCFDLQNGDRTKCEAPQAQSALELYPFFDVQLTKLARWTDLSSGDPVVVSNDELATDNTHDRGRASLAGGQQGLATTRSKIETGNAGLVSLAPIKLQPPTVFSDADLYVRAGGVVTPPPTGGAIISGSLTNAGGTSTSVASVSGDGALCTRPTNTTFSCVINTPITTNPPVLTVGNYYTKNLALIACSPGLTQINFSQGNNKSQTWTRFYLPTTATTVAITIQLGTSCP